ncbi:ribosomal protection-like ABC-F family protein [Bacillaceae bacterium W0354]
MYLLKAEQLSMEVGGRTLFENISIEIKENERIALIGENGVGKTTLIRGILGLTPIHAGRISLKIDREKIGYMVQESEQNELLPVKDWIVADHLNYELKNKLDYYSKQLLKAPDPKLTEKYNELLQSYLEVDGYEWEMKAEKLLTQMGLTPEIWTVPFSNLSGGQKTRAKLVKLMLSKPKLIILDEPTNHLDIATVQWLENWLKQFDGSVLFISHEREFIDHVATSTYEITSSGTKKYQGGYSSYKEQKDLELKTIQNQFEKQEQERKKLIEMIQQYKEWYDKANAKASVRNPYAQKKAAKQANKFKVKERELDTFQSNAIEKPKEKLSISAQLVSGEFSGRNMIALSNVSKAFGDQQILKDVSFHLQQRDRLAVIGPNGSGKTTLLRLMAGIIEPDSGVIKHNPQLKIGKFFQELEQLNAENTILDEILELPDMKQSDARTILACFLFRGDDVFKKIKNISMGEKCRVAFVKLYFSNANLLILDEPTNYLDIASREIIEEALEQYPGSIVIVAHDPYLLRKIANQVLSIKDGETELFHGSYQEWEEHVNLTPIQQQLTNEIQQLELKVLELMTIDDDESLYEDEKSKVKQIKELNEKITRLRTEL